MARPKAATTTASPRTLFADHLRTQGAHVAGRLYRLGDRDAKKRHQARLALAEGDATIEVQDWELMHVLPPDEARAVHSIGGAFLLHADGTYEPATSAIQGRRLMG